MWTLVLFDLPTTTLVLQRAYEHFRKDLLRIGFEMFQKSVYLRWEESEDAAASLRGRVLSLAPKDGHVTVLPLTRRTWQTVRVKIDGTVRPPRQEPENFLILD